MNHKLNAPSYTIGQAPKLKQTSDYSPGPGSYTVRKILEKGVKFSRTPRITLKSNPGPGPGKYELTSFIGKGPAPIITSRNLVSLIQHSPGPGYYSPRTINRGVKYSFSRESKSLRIKLLPGPGSYSPNILKKSPSAFMGSAKRSTKNFEVFPGPGAYNLKRDLRKKILTFPKAQRMMSMKKILPGPGDYSPKITYQTPKINVSRTSSMMQNINSKYSIDLSKKVLNKKDLSYVSSVRPEKITESKKQKLNKDFIGQIKSVIKNLKLN